MQGNVPEQTVAELLRGDTAEIDKVLTNVTLRDTDTKETINAKQLPNGDTLVVRDGKLERFDTKTGEFVTFNQDE